MCIGLAVSQLGSILRCLAPLSHQGHIALHDAVISKKTLLKLFLGGGVYF